MNAELKAAYELVLEDMEDRNSHVLGRLLKWDSTGIDEDDELMYRTWLVAKNFMYGQQGLDPTPFGGRPPTHYQEPIYEGNKKSPRI